MTSTAPGKHSAGVIFHYTVAIFLPYCKLNIIEINILFDFVKQK